MFLSDMGGNTIFFSGRVNIVSEMLVPLNSAGFCAKHTGNRLVE